MALAMKQVTASVNSTLDRLLEEMCETVQLTETQFDEAEGHYHAVGEWLADPKSPLAIYKPRIYPQGSVRLKTTVKPLTRQEHDLDLICLFDLPYGSFAEPVSIFNLVERRLRESDFFRDNMETYKRCIRSSYKSEFHLDITPARPDRTQGGNCILVPDQKIRRWKESNPIGYAEWFESRALMSKTARMAKSIESLPEQESARQKASLRRAVQLMKRNRDCRFGDDADAPRSIVLTTLAAQSYGGQELVSDALLGILDGIILRIESELGAIEVPNPVNDAEKFCEAWAANHESYQKFVDYAHNLRDQLLHLLTRTGLEHIARGLNDLFGEKLTKKAVASYTKKFQQEREANRVRFDRMNVSLSTVAPAIAAAPVPRNTFYGE